MGKRCDLLKKQQYQGDFANMASSPTEFLTFYRRLATSSTFRHAPVSKTNLSRRAFANSSRSRADTVNGHVTSTKGTQQGPMSGDKVGGSKEGSMGGRASRAQNTGGQATREKDERNSTKRAKEEFPEAPDVVIGMQDERGGKGV